MNKTGLALCLVVASFACRSAAPSPVPANAPAAIVVAPDAQPAPDVTPAPDVSAAVDAPQEAPRTVTAQERFLRALAAGELPAGAAVVDPAWGVTRVMFLEAPPSGEGRERIETHRDCGANAAGGATVRAMISSALSQADHLETITCDASSCVVGGMEYAPTWYVRFRAGDGGTPVIESVVSVSEATMSEAWLARSRAYIDRALAEQRTRRCGAR